MNIGIGISLANYRPVPTAPLEDLDAAIAALFGSGEVGAWYDPSDSTTVFQDAAGTTPATVGDPVGLILDKSQGLTLGAELTINGTFDTATSWTGVNGTTEQITGGKLVFTNALSENPNVYQALSSHSQSDVYKITVAVSNYVSGGFVVRLYSTSSQSQTINSNGEHTFYLAQQGSVNGNIGFIVQNNTTLSIDSISVKKVAGNHARQTTSAARPVLQQSGDLYYLDFDGVDDSMSTAAIDLTATDQIDYGFGLRRDRINAAEIIAELGNNSGSLGHFYAALQVSSKLEYVANGNVPASFAMLAIYSPVGASSFVSVSQNEVVPPLTSIRLNGSLVASNTTTRGIGNFGTWPLYIGSRASNSLRFDGAIYSYVMVNRTLTAGEITDLESYLAAKSGVTL